MRIRARWRSADIIHKSALIGNPMSNGSAAVRAVKVLAPDMFICSHVHHPRRARIDGEPGGPRHSFSVVKGGINLPPPPRQLINTERRGLTGAGQLWSADPVLPRMHRATR